MKKLLVFTLVSLMILSVVSIAGAEDKVKIGFLVKMPEEGWFQDEWEYAEQAGEEFGFEVIKIGATDGGKVLTAIDNIAVQGAQGFVICTPDVKLGPAIVAKAKANDLKVMSVDDRFVDSDGEPMEEVPHMGISAYEIGKLVGKTLAEQLEKKDWDMEEVGCLRMSYDQLPTLKDRTDGATDALLEAGFPEENIYDCPMEKDDAEGAFNAANITINKHPEINKWISFGPSDSTTIGSVRALEGQNFGAESVISVGINGDTFAVNEFEKDEPTGFYGSVKLDARKHGYGTAKLMYEWITEGKKPPKVTWTAGTLITRENYKEFVE
ncbi:MAG: arabinose ABC transporter substrate-binding protein [Halanaerobiales bacterium]|nr:arabinose ABC transporter substrate-binding protein [Halanaerobiales bacterium]